LDAKKLFQNTEKLLKFSQTLISKEGTENAFRRITGFYIKYLYKF